MKEPSFNSCGGPFSNRFESMGIRKAAVFPDPVEDVMMLICFIISFNYNNVLATIYDFDILLYLIS